MEQSWFDKLKALITETLSKGTSPFPKAMDDVQRDCLRVFDTDGKIATLDIDLLFGWSGMGSFVPGMPMVAWEAYKQKFAELADTVFVTVNGEQSTLGAAVQKMAVEYPAAEIDLTRFHYAKGDAFHFYETPEGEEIQFNIKIIG